MNEYTKIISLAKLCNIFLKRERHQCDKGHSQKRLTFYWTWPRHKHVKHVRFHLTANLKFYETDRNIFAQHCTVKFKFAFIMSIRNKFHRRLSTLCVSTSLTVCRILQHTYPHFYLISTIWGFRFKSVYRLKTHRIFLGSKRIYSLPCFFFISLQLVIITIIIDTRLQKKNLRTHTFPKVDTY